jgi:hypothetical protein
VRRALKLASGLLPIAFLAAGCGRPPLRVQPIADGFVIDVMTLGEYQTTVERIRLLRHGERVWEAEARPGTRHQIWTFLVRTGANGGEVLDCGGTGRECPSPEPYGDFACVFPPGGGFAIQRGEVYELEVWGGTSWLSRARVELAP